MGKYWRNGNSLKHKVPKGKRHEQACHDCWTSPEKHYYTHCCDVGTIRAGRVYCYRCADERKCKKCGKLLSWLAPKGGGADIYGLML
jgi:hypothetical protein